jgi:hypothetical protein
MTQRYAYLLFLVCLASLAAAPVKLEAQERQPYSVDQIIELIESGVFSETRILMLVKESCIGFRFDEEAARRISEAGGSAELIGGLREVCPSGFLDMVIVTPAELDMAVGATRILRAQAMAPDSTQITGVVFEWTSADTAVAEVSGGGMVLAKASGAVRIAATTQEGPSGTAVVRVGAAAGPEAEEMLEADAAGGKSVGTTAALGVVVPGGGEFYTGNTGKGAVVLAGSAAALAAGYFITSEEILSVSYSATEEILSVSYSATDPGTCQPESCTFNVTRSSEVKTTNNLVYGAAAAGALWLYGLIDGIRSAKKSQVAPTEGQDGGSPGISLEVAPADGVRYTAFGEVQLTLIRIRS